MNEQPNNPLHGITLEKLLTQLVDHYGWTSVVYNHITLRVPGTNEFLINPFGLRYDEISASNLIRVDVDGNKKSESNFFQRCHEKE